MYKRLIPSLLLQNQRLVKGRCYSDYKDAGNPATTARAHNHQGADELIVCDIEASRLNQEPDWETLSALAQECFMPLIIFGGINSLKRAKEAMKIGADKVGITSYALRQIDLISELAHVYGSQAVVVGIDVIQDRNGSGYYLYNHINNEVIKNVSVVDFLEKTLNAGAGELRIMAVHKEGTLEGLDLELYDFIRPKCDVPIIFEGGAGSLHDIMNAYQHGVESIGIGAKLIFSDFNLVKIQQHMRNRNIALRN